MFFEIFGAFTILFFVLAVLVAIAPLFIWLNVRQIRLMMEEDRNYRRRR